MGGLPYSFTSQAKSLLAGGVVFKERSPSGVMGFLMMGSAPEPYTAYQDIFSISSGCYMYKGPIGVGSKY